jgi:hypothetical protein
MTDFLEGRTYNKFSVNLEKKKKVLRLKNAKNASAITPKAEKKNTESYSRFKRGQIQLRILNSRLIQLQFGLIKM